MSAAIDLHLSYQPLERVESSIAVAGFFTDERPLRGGAARADWRLCGGLSRRIEDGDLSGKSGEALLIGCGRALRAPRLLLVGLGDRQAFDQLNVSDETRLAVDRCLQLRCLEIALSPLGVSPDDVPRHAPALIEGIRDATRDFDEPLSIQLCVPRKEISGVARALETACRAASADRVSVTAPAPER